MIHETLEFRSKMLEEVDGFRRTLSDFFEQNQGFSVLNQPIEAS